jgi:hypothetical protein
MSFFAGINPSSTKYLVSTALWSCPRIRENLLIERPIQVSVSRLFSVLNSAAHTENGKMTEHLSQGYSARDWAIVFEDRLDLGTLPSAM